MRTRLFLIALFLVVTLLPLALFAADAPPKVMLPGVRCYQGVGEGVGQVLGDLVLEALMNRHGIRALGPTDVAHMLKAEKQKKLLGCDDESCYVELAGALGADWLIGGSVGKLDEVFVLSLMLIDSKESRVTARASQTIERLKQAPEVVGPMVDKLLGARAKPQAQVPGLKRPEDGALKREPWSQAEYKRRFLAYRDMLAKGPFQPKALLEARRAMLEDLVVTPMPADFKAKRIVIFSYDGALDNELSRQWRASVQDAAVVDALSRSQEWWTFKDQLEKVQYAYERGLKMEEQGTGLRINKLPFELKPSVLDKAPENRVVNAYLDAWSKGRRVVEKAIEALRAADEQAFRDLWSTKAKSSKSTIPGEWKQSRRDIENGFDLRPCLKSMLTAREAEDNAVSYAESGRLRVCYVRVRDQYASSCNAYLTFEGGRWRIDSW